MRVAVATNDGVHVNEPCIGSGRFMVYEYELDENSRSFVEDRRIDMPGPMESPDFEKQLQSILKALGDCEKIFATDFQGDASRRFQEKGIDAVRYEGPISTIPLGTKTVVE